MVSALLDAINALKVPKRATNKPLRIPVQKVYKTAGVGTVITGRVETGVLRVGRPLLIGPTIRRGSVFSIESHNRQLTEAPAGTCVSITAKNISKIDIEQGFVLSDARHDATRSAMEFTAQIVILKHPGCIRPGYTPTIYCHAIRTTCRVTRLVSKLNRSRGEEVEKAPDFVREGDACIVEITPTTYDVFEAFHEYPSLSRIILRDSGELVAVGVTQSVNKTDIPVEYW